MRRNWTIILFACQSFAWFTSKDEVTNRLTASSDYGVSIVESFAPPANWIPGQQVNKDVYAVNTGSVDAYVKETITGILDYTFEGKVATWDEKCIELTETAKTAIDGATTNEGGSFLAWTNVDPATEGYIAPGTVNSARIEDGVDKRWEPTAEGIYIFRRSITPAKAAGEGYVSDPDAINAMSDEDKAANALLAPQPEKYTYAGYFFKPSAVADDQATPDVNEGAGKYYKIVLGTDNFRAESEEGRDADGSKHIVFDVSAPSDKLGGDAVVGENGIITGTPLINYVKETKVDATNVIFDYINDDATAHDGAPYLAVRFANDSGDANARTDDLDNAQQEYDAAVATLKEKQDALAALQSAYGAGSHALAQAEVDLRNAEGAYNSAKSRYDQTKADYDYANALKNAVNDLITAANARKAAEELRVTKENDLTSKKNAVVTEATNEKTAFDGYLTTMNSTLAFNTIVPATVQQYINNNGFDGNSNLTNAKANMEALKALWADIQTYAANIDTAYTNLKNVTTGTGVDGHDNDTTPAQIQGYYDSLSTNMNALNTALSNYQTTFTNFKAYASNAVPEAYLTGLDAGDAVDFATSIGNMTTAKSSVDGAMKTAVDNYKASYTDYHDYVTDNGIYDGDDDPTLDPSHTTGYQAALTAWTTAVSDYNTAVTNAKNTYDAAINTEQKLPNKFAYLQDGTGANEGKKVLKNYGKELVFAYSADHVNGTVAGNADSDPTIADDSAYTVYMDKTAVTVADEADFEQMEADPVADGKQKLGNASTGLLKKKNDAYNALYGEGGDATNPVDGSALGAFNTANTPELAAALAAINAAKAEVIAAETAVDNAYTALTNAQTALTNAAQSSEIKIDVVLDKQQADNWDFASATDNTNAPAFYYKHVLPAGETSEKLIDYLYFCDDVSVNDYKDLTFDLNVKLDSAQVTYDENNRNYTATAVNDVDDPFVLDVTNVDPITKDTVLTWANV